MRQVQHHARLNETSQLAAQDMQAERGILLLWNRFAPSPTRLDHFTHAKNSLIARRRRHRPAERLQRRVKRSASATTGQQGQAIFKNFTKCAGTMGLVARDPAGLRQGQLLSPAPRRCKSSPATLALFHDRWHYPPTARQAEVLSQAGLNSKQAAGQISGRHRRASVKCRQRRSWLHSQPKASRMCRQAAKSCTDSSA